MTTTTEFSLDWPHGYLSRDGREARLICRNSPEPDLPLISVQKMPDGHWETWWHAANGMAFPSEERCRVIDFQVEKS